jgi:hypothetical protein
VVENPCTYVKSVLGGDMSTTPSSNIFYSPSVMKKNRSSRKKSSRGNGSSTQPRMGLQAGTESSLQQHSLIMAAKTPSEQLGLRQQKSIQHQQQPILPVVIQQPILHQQQPTLPVVVQQPILHQQ